MPHEMSASVASSLDFVATDSVYYKQRIVVYVLIKRMGIGGNPMQASDQILQKLEEIEKRFTSLELDVKALDAAQKARDDIQKVQKAAEEQRLTRIEAEMKETRTEVKETRTEIVEIRKEAADQRVSQARVEAKLDGLIEHLKEQKADHTERWKITGIVASILIGGAALVKSFFFG